MRVDTSRVTRTGTISDYREPSLAGAFVLSAVLAVCLLGVLVTLAGPWEFIAVTRLLDPLVEGGFVQYHDLGPGFIPGLPEVGYYYMSQDEIDWRLVLTAALFMAAFPFLKGMQFHVLARLYGSEGSFGAHLRGYFYGDGLDRFLPFGMGRIARAQILVKTGMPRDRAKETVLVQQGFTLFEIAAFALVGLSLLGWVPWFSQMFWALVFLGAAYYIVAVRIRTVGGAPPWQFAAAVRGLLRLGQQRPGLLVALCILSLLAFGVLDLATYVTMTAFDTEIVLINIERPVLLMGIVGGYIAARLVPITPGGIGQWELGFATGLYLGQSDVSVAMFAVALLANLIRIITGLLLMGLSMLRHEIPTNLSEVCDVFMGRGYAERAYLQEVENHQNAAGHAAVAAPAE